MKTKNSNRKSRTKASKNKTSKKYKKGSGLFNFFSKKVIPSECNLDYVNQLNEPEELHKTYQTCCPTTFGFKNRSSLCKQIDSTFQKTLKERNASLGYHGDESDPEKLELIKNEPLPGQKMNCGSYNIDNINNSETLNSLYNQCCPKIFGFKNSSTQCKKIDAKLIQMGANLNGGKSKKTKTVRKHKKK
jgi:hypothetical protein